MKLFNLLNISISLAEEAKMAISISEIHELINYSLDTTPLEFESPLVWECEKISLCLIRAAVSSRLWSFWGDFRLGQNWNIIVNLLAEPSYHPPEMNVHHYSYLMEIENPASP